MNLSQGGLPFVSNRFVSNLCFRDFDRKGGKLKKKNHKAYLNIYVKAIHMIFCDHVCLFSGIASLSWKAIGFLEGTDRTGFYKLT